ncbi:MAG TPA: formylglycine-generating enzyme family protein [Candidatus Paceibacterota bacterium]|nr:formylglycine-generating enzyme family protein [Candidatus Paceibacterota bacterium]
MYLVKSLNAVAPVSRKQRPSLMHARRVFQRLLLISTLTLFAAFNSASADVPCGVTSVQLYAGITITGAVDRVHAIQTTTTPAQPNSWVDVAILTLPSSPYLYFDTQNPAIGNRFYRAVRVSVTTNMIYIPPGSFTMGSPTSEVDRWPEETQHTVVLTRGFYMGKYPVRQSEYLAVMGVNPSRFPPTNGYPNNLNCPVEQVSWSDATNYCAKFTQQEAAAGRLAPGWHYRLPTEAEWEYVCRAGTTTRFSYGDDPGYVNLTAYAWYWNNGMVTTHPVGQKMPNPWGFSDVHGNVLEWCLDWYGTYPSGTVTDPQGPSSGQDRVCRGGHYFHSAGNCRSAQRDHKTPTMVSDKIGFRLVLAPL